MIVQTRHVVPGDGWEAFAARAREALAVLAAKPGFVRAEVARSIDDPGLVLLRTEWDEVGSYRRALSAFDVKVGVAPFLATAMDEPSAFEVLLERTQQAEAWHASDVGTGDVSLGRGGR